MDSTNISNTIIETINKIITQLTSSIDNKLYSILDNLAFVNSDILKDNNLEKIFGNSSSNGILLIANALLLGLILYFAIKYLLSHLTYSQIENPSQFIFKLIIFGICMNFSYFLVNLFLDLICNISFAILNIGENIFNKNISFSELINTINSNISIEKSTIDFFSLDGIIKSIISFSLLDLVFSYSFRYIMIKVFVLLAPFAILSLSLNNTSWFFKSWLKNLFSLLFIQIIISIILLILFSVNYSSSNLISKFIYVGGLYALIKSNSFVREFLGSISTNISQNVNNLINFKK
ncbi:MAG: hypothetical protein IJH39_00740 [Clostridia bacterium]|nr:hypothetical protein [Clostridia bacterium]